VRSAVQDQQVEASVRVDLQPVACDDSHLGRAREQLRRLRRPASRSTLTSRAPGRAPDASQARPTPQPVPVSPITSAHFGARRQREQQAAMFGPARVGEAFVPGQVHRACHQGQQVRYGVVNSRPVRRHGAG
jgi:hypothetical protein